MIDFLKKSWSWIVGGIGAVIGLLWYFLTLKNREVNSLKASLDLVDTEKAADLIEADIKRIRDDKKRTQTEIKQINKVIDEVQKKRDNIKQTAKKASDQEIVDFWNK